MYFRLLITLIVIGSISAIANSVEVRVINGSGYPGETKVTQIMIDSLTELPFITGIIAIDIELTYNPNILIAKSVARGVVIPPEWTILGNTQNPGKVLIQMMSD